MNRIANTIKELDDVAKAIIETHKDAHIFAFYGEMGAGKTTLIKAICKHLSVNQAVNSPTFAIINEYIAHDNTVIYHFDFYRIKNISEAFDMGYEEYFYSGNYCFIEWPEKIEALLPHDSVRITLEDNEGKRLIII